MTNLNTHATGAETHADLSSLRVAELQALATRLGVPGVSKLRKGELVEAISEIRRATDGTPDVPNASAVVPNPAVDAPVAQASVAQEPVAQAPVADGPVAETPGADAAVADAAVADAPVADAPVSEAAPNRRAPRRATTADAAAALAASRAEATTAPATTAEATTAPANDSATELASSSRGRNADKRGRAGTNGADQSGADKDRADRVLSIKQEIAQQDAAKHEAAKHEAAKHDAAKHDAAKRAAGDTTAGNAMGEPASQDADRQEKQGRQGSRRTRQGNKADQSKADQSKADQSKADQSKADREGSTIQGGIEQGATDEGNADQSRDKQSNQPEQSESRQSGRNRNGRGRKSDRNERGNEAGADQSNNDRTDHNDRTEQGAERGTDRNDRDRNRNADNQGRSDRDNQGRGDDGDTNDRSGRSRYRDRKRRGSGAQEDFEPEISEDDVLVPVAGILDVLDNYAFVRTSGYLPGTNDVYVSLGQVKKYHLRKGDAVVGSIRQPREGENTGGRQKYNAIVKIDSVNGLSLDEAANRVEFQKLTPLYPQDRLRLETEASKVTTRIIDLVSPIGKGQRGLIVAPPKAGKTIVMQQIANAISINNPEVHLMVVLVDERPEEVTDMQRTVKGEVIASTFDRPAEDHTTVAELAIERAKRLVELGHDVVVLLDSITRLGRAYNLTAPASGRILSGGVDASALYPPKRFFGAARNIENGGSLTIIASALVETGSKMDEVIFEEFKGTGNMELRLSRQLADKRIFPAVDVNASGTRREEMLMSADETKVTWKLRRALAGLDTQQALEIVLGRLKETSSNVEFLMQVQKSMPTANGSKES